MYSENPSCRISNSTRSSFIIFFSFFVLNIENCHNFNLLLSSMTYFAATAKFLKYLKRSAAPLFCLFPLFAKSFPSGKNWRRNWKWYFNTSPSNSTDVLRPWTLQSKLWQLFTKWVLKSFLIDFLASTCLLVAVS